MYIVGIIFFLAGLATTGISIGYIFQPLYGGLVVGIGVMYLGYRLMTTGLVADMQKSMSRGFR